MQNPKIAKKVARIEELIAQSRAANAIIDESFAGLESWVRSAARAGLDRVVIPQIAKLYRSLGKDLGLPKTASTTAIRASLLENGYTRN